MRRVLVMIVALGICGCEDKAKPKYRECVAAEAKGDVLGAASACEAAVTADATSTSGKAAADKLKAMQPAIEKARAEKKAAEEKAAAEKKKADEAGAKAKAEARAEAAKVARRKVERRYDGTTRDGECIDKGLPDYRWEYEGGSRDEIDLVAEDDGCRHLLPGRSDFNLFKVFCCPKVPGGLF